MHIKFIEWLSGVIDGNGRIILSKKGYGAVEVSVNVRDEGVCRQIKKYYGGRIITRNFCKCVRYQLHDKVKLLKLLKDLEGIIRKTTRLMEYNKLCRTYNMQTHIIPKRLIYKSG